MYVAGGPTPPEVSECFVRGKKTYIGQHEIAWATAPYVSIPSLFTGQDPIHWIDNTSALAGLIKGYAKVVDMARLANGLHAFLLTTECDPYWDYVRSKANVADLPSRPDLRPELDQILHEMGFEPDQIQTVAPRFPPAGQWSLPSASWIELAKHGMNTRPVQTRDSTRKRRR